MNTKNTRPAKGRVIAPVVPPKFDSRLAGILRQHGDNGHEPAVLTIPGRLSAAQQHLGVHNRSYKGVDGLPDTGGNHSLKFPLSEAALKVIIHIFVNADNVNLV
ncbi:hypothetical protein [Paenibacillus sp. 22594]|uniref:hypothetical protein n=1 Tax=Paenibacillus sp. 22594 TaxID=3453947 RepID=UPI003F85A92D